MGDLRHGPSDMNKTKILTDAMRVEKDNRVYTRILAVRSVLLGNTTAQTAEIADVTQRTVQMWVERFELDGVDGLRDSPNRGKKPKVPVGRIKKIATRLRRMEKLTPKKMRNWVRRKLHVTYSVGSIRRILRTMGFSLKTSTTKLANAADAKEVRRWQREAKDTIRLAKRRGFRITVQDESIFVSTGRDGRKFWSPVGDRIEVQRSGRRERVVVYGTVADDGTRLMHTYDKFNSINFVRYLKQARKKWGKVLMVMDNASQHKTGRVRRYLKKNPDVVLLYLPVARPELSGIEPIWKDAKYRLVTSAFYDTADHLKRAVSEYFRTCSIKVDIYKYLERRV